MRSMRKSAVVILGVVFIGLIGAVVWNATRAEDNDLLPATMTDESISTPRRNASSVEHRSSPPSAVGDSDVIAAASSLDSGGSGNETPSEPIKTTGLRGRVVDAAGIPVASATVILVNLVDRESRTRVLSYATPTTTNDDGRFEWTGIATGRKVVNATRYADDLVAGCDVEARVRVNEVADVGDIVLGDVDHMTIDIELVDKQGRHVPGEVTIYPYGEVGRSRTIETTTGNVRFTGWSPENGFLGSVESDGFLNESFRILLSHFRASFEGMWDESGHRLKKDRGWIEFYDDNHAHMRLELRRPKEDTRPYVEVTPFGNVISAEDSVRVIVERFERETWQPATGKNFKGFAKINLDPGRYRFTVACNETTRRNNHTRSRAKALGQVVHDHTEDDVVRIEMESVVYFRGRLLEADQPAIGVFVTPTMGPDSEVIGLKGARTNDEGVFQFAWFRDRPARISVMGSGQHALLDVISNATMIDSFGDEIATFDDLHMSPPTHDDHE